MYSQKVAERERGWSSRMVIRGGSIIGGLDEWNLSGNLERFESGVHKTT
jgi:hypothetical protein